MHAIQILYTEPYIQSEMYSHMLSLVSSNVLIMMVICLMFLFFQCYLLALYLK